MSKRKYRYSRTVVMALITAIIMLPIAHAIGRSIAPPGYLNNYVVVLNDGRLPRFFLNSIIVSGSTIALTVICSSLAGFAFSKLHFPFKNVIFSILVITLLIPFATLIVPLFMLVRGLGLYNSYLGIILPLVAFGVPFHSVLVRNYFNSIPNELLDAARIDGCSDFGVFRRIMLPLSLPIQVVVVVLTFLGSWNNYLLPLIMLRDPLMYTVPVAASRWAFATPSANPYGLSSYDTLFAGLLLMAAPTVIIFMLLQRVFIGSVTAGAIKN